MQASASWLITLLPLIDFDCEDWELLRCGNEHRKFIPVNAYPTANGFIFVAIGNDIQWRRLVELPRFAAMDRPVILVADDLPPSTAVQLPLDKMLGFALEMGGQTSHTTIIARSLGIPVIVGARGSCEEAKRSRSLALDAFEGKIVFDPNPAELSEFQSRQREYQEGKSD